jgi:CO/xanthine dehydrogenase Mo-binding subunit
MAEMKKKGRGIACMWYPVGFTVMANPGAVTVKMNEDGTVMVLNGTVEIGQGSTTVLAQIAAEELGVAPSDVTMITADTDSTPMDSGPIASRTTYVTGNAARLAAAEVKKILFEVAAPLLGARPDQLEARDRKIQVVGFPQRNLPIGEVALKSQAVFGRPAVGSASFSPPTIPLDPKTGQGKPYSAYVYATHIAEVEVDTETGRVDVLRVVAAQDCGTPINPMLVEGQVQGGVAMGIGMALSEDLIFENGRQVNPSLANYMVPTSVDVPPIEVIIVKSYDPSGPFGAKGVGEPTLVATAPAILNAIYDAVGIRLYSLPATPEKVLQALREKEARRSPP